MSVRRPLVVWADIGPEIGMGHVMRTKCLADAWKKRGGETYFFTGIDKNLTSILSSCKKTSVFIIDGPRFPASYLEKIRKAGHKLLVIDDLLRHPIYDTDILLNPNPNAETFSYKTQPETLRLMGTRYTPIREEILEQKRYEPRPYSLLITMGGSDPLNLTEKSVEALLDLPHYYVLNVVLGPMFSRKLPHFKLKSGPKVYLHHNPKNLPQLMAHSTLALSAAGSTCWELSYLGVPFLTFTVSDNQEGIAEELNKSGLAESLGDPEYFDWSCLASKVKQLVENPNSLTSLSKKLQASIDGKGIERILNAIESHLY